MSSVEFLTTHFRARKPVIDFSPYVRDLVLLRLTPLTSAFSQLSGWEERALQEVYLRGLSEELKDELAARDETSSLEELISLALRLDNRLCERHRQRAPPLQSKLPLHPDPPSAIVSHPAASSSSSNGVGEDEAHYS